MSFLSDQQKEELCIERMIFHVVDPEHAGPQFLAEVSPPQCVEFFAERIRETLKGAAYNFVSGSGLPSLLRRALPTLNTTDEFASVSHDLAERFKDKVKQDRRLAPGVLMFLLLKTTGNEKLCAIIKYEHQQVVSYSYVKNEDGSVIPPKTSGAQK
ncbi:nucleoid-associated protein [Marinobacter fonticola]|uniref:nucleoid-associated protein n=1 Tax=Marinobacter fonticola TaxID=2603215 RepID=UPI0011E6424F|nr:nucleoid-associated protein [Marinobacter fonticola]